MYFAVKKNIFFSQNDDFEDLVLTEDTSNYFYIFDKIDIIETYPNAHEELEKLFPNIYVFYENENMENKHLTVLQDFKRKTKHSILMLYQVDITLMYTLVITSSCSISTKR